MIMSFIHIYQLSFYYKEKPTFLFIYSLSSVNKVYIHELIFNQWAIILYPPFILMPIGGPLSCTCAFLTFCSFERFITFWYRYFRFVLYFCHFILELVISPKIISSSTKEWYGEAKIQVFFVLIATGMFFLLNTLRWQSKEMCVYISLCIYMPFTTLLHLCMIKLRTYTN